MFTQRHYEFFAKKLGLQIREASGDTEKEIFLYNNLQFFTDIFEEDSAKFKKDLFAKRVQEYIKGER